MTIWLLLKQEDPKLNLGSRIHEKFQPDVSCIRVCRWSQYSLEAEKLSFYPYNSFKNPGRVGTKLNEYTDSDILGKASILWYIIISSETNNKSDFILLFQ